MSILDVLYFDFSERLPYYGDNKEYKNLRKISDDLEESLYATFDKDTEKLYEDVRLSQMDVDEWLNKRMFKKAFTFGALVMLEMMGEIKDGI